MDLYEKSINIILNNQSEYGSFIASPSFDKYKFSWMRDGSFIANSLDVAGKYDSSYRFFLWADTVIKRYANKIDGIACKISKGEKLEKSDFLNARLTLDGFDEKENGWGNFQLDGYGTWLWALAMHIERTGRTEILKEFRESVDLFVKYINSLWYYPNYDIWEENGDKIHTSTLACLYGGLNSINKYLDNDEIRCLAAKIKAYILTNCIENGYFIKYIGTEDVDASLIWLAVPFEVVGLRDPVFTKTVSKIEEDLLHSGGMHRYKKDTYYGGGEWVLLSCWMGWYYSKMGDRDKAESILKWVEKAADKNGNLPEQVCEHMNESDRYSYWLNLWGEPATPLLWSHAMYIILKDEVNI